MSLISSPYGPPLILHTSTWTLQYLYLAAILFEALTLAKETQRPTTPHEVSLDLGSALLSSVTFSTAALMLPTEFDQNSYGRVVFHKLL